ncbi:uncharacterized protein LOC144905519 [Branchiostoma floridae x Branchiostoma belcheri]
MTTPRFQVLWYVPNVIGYIRLALLLAAWLTFDIPMLFLPFYTISIILDGIDGWAARKLNQVSAFGAWLDVAVDCVGRSLLWCCLYQWGFFLACLEWLVFVCTHNMGPAWRSTTAPWWVEAVMAKGFKTPAGTFAITGLHVLPLWLYGHVKGVQLYSWHLPPTVHYTAILLLAAGRALCVPVELWFVWNHVHFLISEKPGPAT